VQTLSDGIAPSASKSYYVPNVLSQPDGRYSVVVSSDQPLFSLVNEVTAGSSNAYVAATHSGFTSDDIGSPLYLPWVVCSYYNYNSMFAVQNAGSGATDIRVEFYQSGQSTAAKVYTFTNVLPGGSIYLDLTTSQYQTDLGSVTSNGFFGAVKISSTGNATPLAAVLNDTNPTGTFLRSYNGVKGASTDLIAAQVTANYYGYSSGITLQNPDPAVTANVVISFYLSGQTTPSVVYNTTVAPSSAKPTYLPNVSGMPSNFNGTAVIHSNIPVMGIANHDHSPSGPAASYNLTAVGDARTTVYMPQVVRNYYNFQSGYQLYNVGPDQVTVDVVFTTVSGAVKTTIHHTIPARSALTYYLGDSRGAGLGDNFNGGAQATVMTGNGTLIGIANFVAPYSGDNMQVYNVFHN
jgi:hypothetical protein